MGPVTGLHLMVFVEDAIWDEIFVLPETVIHSNDSSTIESMSMENGTEARLKDKHSIEKRVLSPQPFNIYESHETIPKYTHRISVDGYFFSRFYILLTKSTFYRQHVVENLTRCRSAEHSHISVASPQVARIDLSTPQRQVIDFNWNNRLELILAERSELDHAMSWFSTFGGAFSALGEEFQRCAEIAGKISLRQMSLALRLGDPLCVSRCRLYWALSKIQKGELRLARRVVEQEFRAANSHGLDARLLNMCRGIWAKLRYSRQLRAEERKKQQHGRLAEIPAAPDC